MCQGGSHTIKILTREVFVKLPIARVVLPKVTKKFVEKANINAILADSDNTVKGKISDLRKLLEFLAEVDIEFTILKMQPVITHLGNDIDLLMHSDYVKPFLRRLRKKFKTSCIELHEGTRRGFKATAHLANMRLSQIEIYTYVGWYGYSFLPADHLNKFRRFAKFTLLDGTTLQLPILPYPYAFIVDVLHMIFANRYISLGDIAKLLLYPSINYTICLEGIPSLMASNAISTFIRSLKECLTEILLNGRCYIPLRYTLSFSWLASVDNIFHNKELDINTYWMELRRVLNVAYRRLSGRKYYH